MIRREEALEVIGSPDGSTPSESVVGDIYVSVYDAEKEIRVKEIGRSASRSVGTARSNVFIRSRRWRASGSCHQIVVSDSRLHGPLV